MATYTAPGVYVEEALPSVRPIAGVGTSTAGFVGVVGDVDMPEGPGTVVYTLADAGLPVLVTSWEHFKNNFGDFQEGNQALAHAVYGFFNNGGTRAWVARVAPAEPDEAPDGEEPDETPDETPDGTGGEGEDDGEVTLRVAAVSLASLPTAQVDAGALDVAAIRAVLAEFEGIDEIALVLAPGVTDETVLEEVVSHCASVGDRFAILDGVPDPAALTPADVKGAVGATGYAAMYFPWITVFDPGSGGRINVAPSGHVAGVYARVDTARGVHKAPANEVIRGALGVRQRLGRNDSGVFNAAGVNTIREINGNVTVWGARTLSDDAAWTYVNVRRFFLFLRESIDEGTQWAVFEPNTPALWSKITRNVTAFLTTVWRSGALFGNTPAEAFYVKCDADTNPPELRDLGQVVTEIGVSVVRPAEFVVFRVSQWAGPQG